MKDLKFNRRQTLKVLSFLALFAGSGSAAFAVDKTLPYREVPQVEIESEFMGYMYFFGAILGIILLMTVIIVGMFTSKRPEQFSLKGLWESITGKNAVDPKMDHYYDGITELNNPMPAYLRLIFYGSIVFGIGYLFHYHVLETGPLQTEEYTIEMAEAELKYQGIELPDDQLIMITDQARLAKAANLFQENCATCHGDQLQGLSGPNLTDDYWLHGGDVKAVYNTITDGVPGKTMISWKKRISSTQRLELASFIMNQVGTNPPDAKAPEGTTLDGVNPNIGETKPDTTQLDPTFSGL